VNVRNDVENRGLTLGEMALETDRLHLELLCESHAAELFQLLSDDRLYLFVPQQPPPSLAALAARYRLLEGRRSPGNDEGWFNWVVRAKADRMCVGVVQVTLRRDGRAQLAYEIGVPHWRHGFATEACGRVVKALFDNGTGEIWAEVDTRNLASIRLLERLGFRRGALRSEADFFKGSNSDEWTYSLVRCPVPP
jgi:[ribosomal protein S5]-alanine N-acetyltransferase